MQGRSPVRGRGCPGTPSNSRISIGLAKFGPIGTPMAHDEPSSPGSPRLRRSVFGSFARPACRGPATIHLAGHDSRTPDASPASFSELPPARRAARPRGPTTVSAPPSRHRDRACRRPSRRGSRAAHPCCRPPVLERVRSRPRPLPGTELQRASGPCVLLPSACP